LLEGSSGAAASKLAVADEFVKEGDWLHVVLYPTEPGIDALDYLDEIAGIENQLRKKFGEEILVVPTKVRD
jgi:hypothetical protein